MSFLQPSGRLGVISPNGRPSLRLWAGCLEARRRRLPPHPAMGVGESRCGSAGARTEPWANGQRVGDSALIAMPIGVRGSHLAEQDTGLVRCSQPSLNCGSTKRIHGKSLVAPGSVPSKESSRISLKPPSGEVHPQASSSVWTIPNPTAICDLCQGPLSYRSKSQNLRLRRRG